ncbi:hypothetical protein [Streptomyces carpaticus]|uniref:hypothetical protein n=1 Tax=Streptomyces carpaticus TaxID=285558 RepID=UPI0031F9D35B
MIASVLVWAAISIAAMAGLVLVDRAAALPVLGTSFLAVLIFAAVALFLGGSHG